MILLFLLAALPALTVQQCFTDDGNLPEDPKLVGELLYKGEPQFSEDIFKEVVSSTSAQKNIIFSPFSIYNALLLAYLIAGGQTEESIEKALHIPSSVRKESVAQAFKAYKAYSKRSTKKYKLSSPSKLFTGSHLRVRKCTKNFFEDEITQLDFLNDLTGAIGFMNSWVADETNNMIKNVFDKSNVRPDTKLSLVNVAYFRGDWLLKFQPEYTSIMPFYVSRSVSKMTSMMIKSGEFPTTFSEKLGARVLAMPYSGDEVSMYVVLPKTRDGLSTVLERFNLNAFHEALTALRNEGLTVSFPKFDIEMEIQNLSQVLGNIGLGDLFQSTANLTGLTDDSYMQFNSAIHKAKVKVDEKGSEVTAVTAKSLLVYGMVRVEFLCDHPFMYLIYEKTSDTIIFMGVYRDPRPRG